MRTIRPLSIVALAIVCAPLAAQTPEGDTWTRALTERTKRGTLYDAFQFVRGDTGKWSDAPQLLYAPPIGNRPPKTPLDDWFDQLLEKPSHQTTSGDESWLLLRTRQMDDNDRLWLESIERKGNQFTIVLNEAIWQGKYFKTFTYYQVLGVNLGKLEPGKYEAKWIIKPLAFIQFTGDGRPATMVSGRSIDNWPNDDLPAEKKTVELRSTFSVATKTPLTVQP